MEWFHQISFVKLQSCLRYAKLGVIGLRIHDFFYRLAHNRFCPPSSCYFNWKGWLECSSLPRSCLSSYHIMLLFNFGCYLLNFQTQFLPSLLLFHCDKLWALSSIIKYLAASTADNISCRKEYVLCYQANCTSKS